jgi:hypothetical protein
MSSRLRATSVRSVCMHLMQSWLLHRYSRTIQVQSLPIRYLLTPSPISHLGHYASSPGSITCSPCPIGYQVNSNRTGCDPCPSGTYAASNGTETCLTCGTGTVSTSVACTACPANSEAYNNICYCSDGITPPPNSI